MNAPSIRGRRWEISRRGPPGIFEEHSDMRPLAVQLLYNRGVVGTKQIDSFLQPQSESIDPFLMSGMGQAVKRLLAARLADESVCVYADYDADGVTAAAVLVSALKSLGINTTVYFPSRTREGYGLNFEALKHIAETGTELVVSVDCGANATEQVEQAVQLGMDVILTDHHVVMRDVPSAIASLNPADPMSQYPFQGLCGVGVAYKLVEALSIETDGEIVPDHLLDLVALGTIADVSPIVNENRHFVIRGLSLMQRRHRIGLDALSRIAGLEAEEIEVSDVAYRLAPRINAAGRMADAQVAFDLLMSESKEIAENFAEKLEALNRQRQLATLETMNNVVDDHVSTKGLPIFAVNDNWASGVVGLVAGRVVEEYGVPAYICSGESGIVRGSVRAPQGFDVIASLENCASCLNTFGGHRAAGGFSLDESNIPSFKKKLFEYWESIPSAEKGQLLIEADCRLYPASVNSETLSVQTDLAPYGMGFSQPVYVCEKMSLDRVTTIGRDGAHVKLRFAELSATVECVWFRGGRYVNQLRKGGHYDVAFTLRQNKFRGGDMLEMNVEDVRVNAVESMSPS